MANKFTKRLLPTAAVLSTALFAQNAFAVFGEDFEYHGYIRSGIGFNSEGGDQVCFQVPGVRTKYRLGNECELYYEPSFVASLFKGEDGAYFKLYTAIAIIVPNQTDFEANQGSSSKLDIALREGWIEAGNVAGGALEGARFWAGKRYYRRHDVHINDWFFWDNSGPGAGIENISLGGSGVKTHIALFQDIIDDPVTGEAAGFQGGDGAVRLDWRVSDIATNPGGSLELGLDIRFSNENDDSDINDETGYGFNVVHFQDKIGGYNGFNKIAFQYGAGPNATDLGRASTNVTLDDDVDAWRVVEMMLLEPNDSMSVLGTVTYEDDDLRGEWFSIGVRPKFYINDYFNVAVEAGYDNLDPDNGGDDLELFKFTVAPQISAGRGFWVRPLLRAFVTYANWNDAAQDAGLAGGTGGVFGDDTDGWTFGFQAESWW